MSRYELHVGDCIESLRRLPEKSIHTCVTSPPYYGLRDYGTEGQIGLEETPEQFIQKLVDVFREVKRVLRDDGTLWLNIGDSYAGYHGNKNAAYDAAPSNKGGYFENQRKTLVNHNGIKNKDLIGIPWMLAFALRADGWYLRQDIIWHKPNPMPESVRDRCTKAHEYLFLLSKSPRYYYDHEAVKEASVCARSPGNQKPHKGVAEDPEKHRTRTGLHGYAERQRRSRDTLRRIASAGEAVRPGQAYGQHRTDRKEASYDVEKRNRRSVWSIATRPFKGAHFATFPPDLVEPCILAGCPVGGTVLDPFAGSGTTAGVALLHGRNAVLCELNADYAALVPQRVQDIAAKRQKVRSV